MFAKILIPVDFSPRAEVGIALGERWAGRFWSHVELFHVLEDNPYVYPPLWPGEAPFFSDLEEAAKRNATQNLEALSVALVERGLRHVSTALESGLVADRIRQRAIDTRAELIVAATQGLTGFSRLVLGSTCERILRHAPCPVLVARPSLPQGPIEKVLVAVDFSDHSRRAVNVAARVAERWGAALHVFHAWPAPYPLADVRIDGDLFSRMCHAAESEVAAFLATCLLPSGIVPTTVIASGTPVSSITAHADAIRADVLCLGTHGRSGVKHLILGSVAEATIRAATCTTLVVP